MTEESAAVEQSFVVRALGSTVQVRWLAGCSSESLATAQRAWSRCLVTDVADPDRELLAAVEGILDSLEEEQVVAMGSDELETLEVITAGVTVTAIDELAGDRLMLHACALADTQTGRAVAMVGPSGTGKTTIAQTLGTRWAYVTDETVAVDEHDRALAYPKPLSIIEGDRKIQHSPDDLGLLPSPSEVEIVKVWFLDRDPARAEATVEPVPTANALALLAEHTSYLTGLDRPLHWLAGLLERTGGLDRIRYGDRHQLNPLLAEALEASR